MLDTKLEDEKFTTFYKQLEKEIAGNAVIATFDSQLYAQENIGRHCLAKEESILFASAYRAFQSSGIKLTTVVNELSKNSASGHKNAIEYVKNSTIKTSSDPKILSSQYDENAIDWENDGTTFSYNIIHERCVTKLLANKNAIEVLQAPEYIKEYMARTGNIIASYKEPVLNQNFWTENSKFNKVLLDIKEEIQKKKPKNNFDFLPPQILKEYKKEQTSIQENKKRKKRKKKKLPPITDNKNNEEKPAQNSSLEAPEEITFNPPPVPTPPVNFTITRQHEGYQPTPYEEYCRRGGVNREFKQKLLEEHKLLMKTRKEPVEYKTTTKDKIFNEFETEFLQNIIFGSTSSWKHYSWNQIVDLLKNAGWIISDNTGSSSVHFTPRVELHNIIGSHSISIHQDHTPTQNVKPYCVHFFKLAFKNSYGITEDLVEENK